MLENNNGVQMTDAEVIAKLAKENLEMKEALQSAYCLAHEISTACVCIGGPLNDNVRGYTKEQLSDWNEIYECSAEIELTCEAWVEDE